MMFIIADSNFDISFTSISYVLLLSSLSTTTSFIISLSLILSNFVTSLSFKYNNNLALILLNLYEYLNDDSFANLLIVALLFLKSTFDAPNINSWC